MADSNPANPPAQPAQIQIALDEETAQGIYANLAMITHGDSEFTLDFIYVQPHQPKAKVRARIITSPQHVKRLLAVMQDNIARYEAKFGTIRQSEPPPNVPNLPVH